MDLLLAIRRTGYRVAYAALRAYWFLARPRQSGVKCLLTDADRVLLVRHTYGHREWDLPGGAVKRTEAPEEAARREMQEELGIAVEHWVSLGVLEGRLDYRRDQLHCFQAEAPEAPLEVERAEIAATRWFAREQLPEDLGRYVRPIVARAQPGGRPTTWR